MDVPVESILNQISDITDWTIIKNPKLTSKKLTILFPNATQTIGQIINKLIEALKDHGYTLEISESEKIIKLVQISDVTTNILTVEDVNKLPKGDQWLTVIVKLKYIQVHTVLSNIKPMLSKYGKFSANSASNTLIITDSASRIGDVFKLLKALDKSSWTSKTVETIYIRNMPIEQMEKILMSSEMQIQIVEADEYPETRRTSPRRRVTTRRGSTLRTESSLQLIKMPKVNAFLVIGTKEDVINVKKFIQKLDIAVLPTSNMKISIVPLKNIKPSMMTKMLNDIFALDGGDEKKTTPSRRRSTAADQSKTMGVGSMPLVGSAKLIEFDEKDAIVIIANDKDTDTIKEIIARFEKQVAGHNYRAGDRVTMAVHLQNQKAEDTVKVFSVIRFHDKPKESPVLFFANATTNSIVFSAPADRVQKILALLKDLDKKLSQVLIEVMITEITLSDQHQFGVDWNIVSKVPQVVRDWGIGISSESFNVKQTFGTKVGTGIAFQNSQTSFIINALQTVGDVNILSTPRILTLDNKEAMINIGKRVAFTSEEISITGTNQDNATTSKKIIYRDVGLKLTVKPHINDEKTVTMDVKQEVNDIEPSGDAAHPNIITRELSSHIMIGHNQTVVLGGLIKTKETIDQQKIPLLGDIPILGFFFKHETKRKEKTQLMLFITPHVIMSPADYQRVKKLQLKDLNMLTDEQKKKLQIPVKVPKK